ncbi:MAG: TetR/AcrR family transcriptional regulator [bacterium]
MAKQHNDSSHEASDARNSLLKAGANLFAAQGYSATGVQQITDAAGVNKATLYYYFKSKEGLYNFLIDEGVRLVERAVTASEDPNSNIEERIKLFLGTFLTVASENPELAKIIFREAFGECDNAQLTVAEHIKDNVRRLAAVLAEAQAKGDLRAGPDPVYWAYSIFGIANMFISRLVVNSQELDVEPLVDHILSLFMQGAEPTGI